MTRLILVVVAAGVVLLLVGLLGLGAFPPRPVVAPVEHVVPNDRFHSGG